MSRREEGRLRLCLVLFLYGYVLRTSHMFKVMVAFEVSIVIDSRETATLAWETCMPLTSFLGFCSHL